MSSTNFSIFKTLDGFVYSLDKETMSKTNKKLRGEIEGSLVHVLKGSMDLIILWLTGHSLPESKRLEAYQIQDLQTYTDWTPMSKEDLIKLQIKKSNKQAKFIYDMLQIFQLRAYNLKGTVKMKRDLRMDFVKYISEIKTVPLYDFLNITVKELEKLSIEHPELTNDIQSKLELIVKAFH